MRENQGRVRLLNTDINLFLMCYKFAALGSCNLIEGSYVSINVQCPLGLDSEH